MIYYKLIKKNLFHLHIPHFHLSNAFVLLIFQLSLYFLYFCQPLHHILVSSHQLSTSQRYLLLFSYYYDVHLNDVYHLYVYHPYVFHLYAYHLSPYLYLYLYLFLFLFLFLFPSFYHRYLSSPFPLMLFLFYLFHLTFLSIFPPIIFHFLSALSPTPFLFTFLTFLFVPLFSTLPPFPFTFPPILFIIFLFPFPTHLSYPLALHLSLLRLLFSHLLILLCYLLILS